MAKVEILRCTSCGSNKVKDIGGGIGRCEHCESTMLLPKKNQEIVSLLNAAYIYRENFNYDLAIKSYQYVLEKDAQELSAYEGILLAEYGIEYVKDSYTNKLIPTCHRAHFKSILEDDNYKALLTLADDEQKKVIEQKALEIDKLQKAIERQLKNEESYDIFISYKATDKNGEKTEDSLIARNIYDELTKKNYKVFFSEKSLEDRLGSEYEPIIFKALHTSKIFILVGTSKEHIESNWVRNEWSRFLDRIKNEPQTLNGNNFIPVFKDMNPYDMPKVNNSFVQGVDANKLGYALTVVDGVQKILKPEKDKKVLDVLDNIENIEQFEKIRKQRNLELKQKRWKEFNENPDNKVKKVFYKLFLYSPYILSLISLIMLCDKHTWFMGNYHFYILIAVTVINLILTILVVCIHKKYVLKRFINIVFPFALIGLTIFSFVICHTVIPFVNFEAYDGYYYSYAYRVPPHKKYYMGMIYEISGDYAYVDFSDAMSPLTKTIDGKKHLILPNEIESKKIARLQVNIDPEIEVLVLPSYHQCEITIMGSDTKLKEIYCNDSNKINISVYDKVGDSSWNETHKSKVTLYYSDQMPSNANEISNNIQQKAFNY